MLYYLLVIENGLTPNVEGPYAEESQRDRRYNYLTAQDSGQNHSFFRIDLDGCDGDRREYDLPELEVY